MIQKSTQTRNRNQKNQLCVMLRLLCFVLFFFVSSPLYVRFGQETYIILLCERAKESPTTDQRCATNNNKPKK